MNLEEMLKQRLRQRDIQEICSECSGNSSIMADLFSLVSHPDDSIGYNALWIFTHFSTKDMKWLIPKRSELIENVLSTKHVGKQRLIMTLLEHQSISKEDVTPNYLDWCLSKINSNEPYVIRALCLKQSFALCRFYPELIVKLKNEIELMEYGALSPGLLSARRNILKKITLLKL